LKRIVQDCDLASEAFYKLRDAPLGLNLKDEFREYNFKSVDDVITQVCVSMLDHIFI
jgi:hypothetical protein